MEPITTALIISAVAGGGTAAVVGKPKKLKNIGERKGAWLKDFIEKAKPVCEKYNIPYQVCVSQAALESGWGIAAPGYNYFGIKGAGSAGTQEFMTSEFKDGVKVTMKLKFAKYESLNDGIEGYCKAMTTNKLFAPASKNFSKDPTKFAIWLWSSGYATAPKYITTVLGIINLILRVTDNKDFDIKSSKEDTRVISTLSKLPPNKRRTACAKELKVSLV